MRRRKGSVTVEFTLVGIPLIFTLISVVEMSRGMWIYHSQAHAVKEGARYVVVKGMTCSTNGNTCTAKVGDIATAISNAGIGLVADDWDITLISASGTNNFSCSPLSSCFGNTTVWPPSPDNTVGSVIAIQGSYQFQTSMAMYWPGTKAVTFGTYNLPAYSQQVIQF